MATGGEELPLPPEGDRTALQSDSKGGLGLPGAVTWVLFSVEGIRLHEELSDKGEEILYHWGRKLSPESLNLREASWETTRAGQRCILCAGVPIREDNS